MPARTAVALGITLFAAAVVLIEAFSWPLSARFGPVAASTFRCEVRVDVPSAADSSAGLRAGDRIRLPDMDLRSRVAGVFHYTPTQAGRAGEQITLAVSRGGSIVRIPYLLQHTDRGLTFAAQMAFKLFLIVLAGVLLWRGTDRASLILGAWCASVGVGLPDAWWGALPAEGRVAGGALTALLWTCSPFILYLTVEAVASGVSRWVKYVSRACMAILILPSVLINVVGATAQAFKGCSPIAVQPWIAGAAFAASQLVIIAFFVLSYVGTTGLAKQRVRWVFWAFMLSRMGVLLNLLNRLLVHPIHLSGFEWITVLIFPLGCAYAILRHRLFDVNFVLNRTLVFTVLTTFIVGVFILTEDLLGKFAASRGVGIAVDVSVALLLGFSFNALHKYVETSIERALFRAKHEAAKSLRRLAEEAPFMEDARALLNRSVREIAAASGAAGTAIYERTENGYRRSAQYGDPNAAIDVDADDLAFVRLRQSRAPVHLSASESVLGTDGDLFPFSIRGALTGALLCRRRPNGEAYAPDEIALLSAVAHEVGAEVHAIRARKQGELLDAILTGAVDVNEARAQVLATSAVETAASRRGGRAV